MTGRFAEGTTVTVSKSKDELERILARYGATSFGYVSEPTRAIVMFQAEGRHVRFIVPMPTGDERFITHTGQGQRRTESARQAAVDKETRRLWRCLTLAVKAKLEVVESGIATFEEEFATHVVLPDQSTVGDWLLPQIERVYETGDMPPDLLGLPSGT